MDKLPSLVQLKILRFLPLSSLPSLLFLNKDWFQETAAFLYRNPFQSLLDITLCSPIDDEDIRDRFRILLTLLLRCCQKEYLLGTEAMTHFENIPTIDYLALYQDQTTRYNCFIEETLNTARNKEVPLDSSLYDRIRLAFATHTPKTVVQLYISMPSLEKLVDYASQFSNLHRLEIYSPKKDMESEALVKFVKKHRLANVNKLQELSLIMSKHWPYLETEPLSLYGWTNLQKLDLTLWRTTFDWMLLPRRNLVELGFDGRGIVDQFDFESFFRPCTKLHTLKVLSAKDWTFSWKTPGSLLPRLTTLEIGSTRDALKKCLDDSFKSFSNALLSLTVTLQEPNSSHFIRRNITWTTPLPQLQRLVIKNKALFEIDLAVLKNCPLLRALNLYVDAERSGFGCTGMGIPHFIKWILLFRSFEGLAAYGGGLEELTMDGVWIIPKSGLLRGILPLVQLRRIRFGGGVKQMDIAGLSAIVDSSEKLKLLEVGEFAVLPTNKGQKSKLFNKEGLEVRLTEYSIFGTIADCGYQDF